MFTFAPRPQRQTAPRTWPPKLRSTDGKHAAHRFTSGWLSGLFCSSRRSPAEGATLASARRRLILAVASERLAFGLLASLLVFQLSERFGLAESRAAAWVGYFLAASYMTPLLGGLLCDRGLPAHTTCVLGCLSMATGYAALCTQHRLSLLLGSVLVLLGTGLFRPGVQLLLDRLLPPLTEGPRADRQRNEAYALMHAVVNVGGMLAPLCSDGLQRSQGWARVSGLSVACMLVALLLIAKGVGRARPRVAAASPLRHTRRDRTAGPPADPTSDRQPCPPHQPRQSLWPLLALCLALIGFWMVYAQSSSTLLLWARDGVDRRLGTQPLPVSVFAALPWALVVLLTPPLLSLFRALHRRGREPDLLGKLRIGFVLLAGGFLALSLSSPSLLWRLLPQALTGAGTPASAPPTHLAWLVLAIFLITLGELCVAPLGPALFLQLAPPRLRGLSVALWFGTLGLGMLASGALSELWGCLSPAAFFALAGGLSLTLPKLARGHAAERLLSLGKS